MTAHQRLQQLRLAAREFTIETIRAVLGRRPSSATVERVARQLVNTLKPALKNAHEEIGQTNSRRSD